MHRLIPLSSLPGLTRQSIFLYLQLCKVDARVKPRHDGCSELIIASRGRTEVCFMTDKIAFGQFILAKRKALGLTQREFARRLFVTESAVSKWERGLSYPDITLVRPICDELGVTEHELITASDDHEQHKIEREAATLRKMSRAWQWTWGIAYAATLVICVIANLVQAHALTWFWIVLMALALSFSITNVPVLAKQHKRVATLGAFFISLVLLVLVSSIYANGVFWFPTTFMALLFGFAVVFLPLLLRAFALPQPLSNHKTTICVGADTVLCVAMLLVIFLQRGEMGVFVREALPIVAFCLPAAWLPVLFWRYMPANTAVRTGLTLLLSAAYIYFGNAVPNAIINAAPFALPAFGSAQLNVYNVFMMCALVAVALVMLAVGVARMTAEKNAG
jgi:transcriptional regulator with XRE-family HTH domain